MATFLYKTRDGSSPERKPRVYFTCHPDDFSKHFDNICTYIFKTHDCAIFYTEDMTAEIEKKYLESDIGQMNLFVMPVTLKLLTEPNRAMDSDFRYAKEKNIPVLPIMTESGLDDLYSRKDKFGELQYLDPYSQDKTAISYADKLRKYLDAVLISNETAERVRKAFDAYIFLSYRKKDRHYANALMKMIHSHPEFRDIAIWYDEFLTPGESFRENIEKMMRDSKLFALLVTPNLLEYVNGEPNYVMAHEYPDAKASGMDIIPAEMEETDKAELRANYEDIPECVNPSEDELFKKLLLDTISKVAVSENNDDPEHNFLIGLAYLDGIDVEIDRERAEKLIKSAADKKLPEAMEKLAEIYCEYYPVAPSIMEYREATIALREELCDYYKANHPATYPPAIANIYKLANLYVSTNSIPREHIEDGEKVIRVIAAAYDLSCKYSDTTEQFGWLLKLANAYSFYKKYESAITAREKIYAHLRETSGTIGNVNTSIAAEMLANEYDNQARYSNLTAPERRRLFAKAADLTFIIYQENLEALGEEDRKTIMSLKHYAFYCHESEKFQEEIDAREKIYAIQLKIKGENDYDVRMALKDLGIAYKSAKNYGKAEEKLKKAYELNCAACGNESRSSLDIFVQLVELYEEILESKALIPYLEELYSIQCKLLGENYHATLKTLHKLGMNYISEENAEKAVEVFEKEYTLRRKKFGENDADTQIAGFLFGKSYAMLGDYEKSNGAEEPTYLYFKNTLGCDHSFTVSVLRNIAYNYFFIGNYQKAAELFEEIYNSRLRTLGADHSTTLEAAAELELTRKKLK